MGKEKALIAVEKLDVTVVFSEDGMSKLLKEIEKKAIAYVPDITSEQGRKDIASLAYKVTRSKTLIDDLGKDVVSDWKKKAKVIDSHRKTARDFLDNLKDTVRQPLTDWEVEEAKIKEEADRKEQEKIETRITSLAGYSVTMPFMEVAALTDDEYEKLFAEKKALYEAEQKRLADEEAARIAESERLAKVALEQEAEAKRLADVQADIDKKQQIESNRLAKLQADIDAKEQKLKDEKERIDRVAFERKAKEDARIQAEKNAKAKAERDVIEAKEKADREAEEKLKAEKAEAEEKARQEKLRPDCDKLIQYAALIIKLAAPDVRDKHAQEILDEAQDGLSLISSEILKQAKDL